MPGIDGSEVIIEARRLHVAAGGGTRKMRALIRHFSALAQTKVMRNASGRPGPNVITGDYRRTIHHTVENTAGGAEGVVETNAVQGARLEYGFVGTDSLGRRYDQAPLPHFRPAADEIEQEIGAALGDFGDDL